MSENRNPELARLPFVYTEDLIEELRLRCIAKDALIQELRMKLGASNG